MKYIVAFSVSGHCLMAVDAETKEKAKDLSEVEFSELDFGELKGIDGEIIYMIDENGEYHYT